MEPKKLKRLADLFSNDLAGWQITYCYFLELDHGLMGMFPALDDENNIVATTNKSALEKVWKKLERRPAKVTSFMVVVHPESEVAFNLESCVKGETEPLRIFSVSDINVLCEKENSVHWAYGLLQLSERPVKDPVFT